MRSISLLIFVALMLPACASLPIPPAPVRAPVPVALIWEGELASGFPLRLTVEGVRAVADFPSFGQAAYAGTVTQAPPSRQVTVTTPAGDLSLTGLIGSSGYQGQWSFLGQTGSFSLASRPAPQSAFREQIVRFTGAGGVQLEGVLLLPEQRGPRPAFVGLHGSGVETRAGANRFLGERLAAEGAIVLLFDKRGSGQSGGTLRNVTLQDLAGDVQAAHDVLLGRPDVDRWRTGLFGASQASWVAAIVAADQPCIRYLMIRSGPLTTVAEEGRFDALNRLRNEPAEVQADAQAILLLDDEVTRSGRNLNGLQQAVVAASGKPWFGTLKFKLLAADEPSRLAYRSWLDFDPEPLLRTSPAIGLWLYGTNDDTVPARRSMEIARALAATGKTYQVQAIEGANHALMRPPEAGSAWPSLADEYVALSTDWYRRHVANDLGAQTCGFPKLR